jgi:tripartite-type tricarboxylate transporter receptor subunit TctC
LIHARYFAIKLEVGPGKLLPLGVTTARRSALLPDVPTIAEHGATPMSMTRPEFARFVESEARGAVRLEP